jgi:nucleoside-diphosphate-sugar epimerase
VLKATRVLVTGGTGFIGSHLCRRLVEEQAQVSIIIEPHSETSNIVDLLGKVEIYQADITDLPRLKEVVKQIRPNKIYHLAALLNPKGAFENIDLLLKVNIGGSINLLHALEDIDYDCFINVGSSEEYGNNMPPFKEDQFPQPISPYSASKSANYLFCHMYHKMLGAKVVTLRPFVVYGPVQSNDMFIPQLILSALRGEDFKMTKGEQTRDFIYVSDVVEGFIKASLERKAIGELINLGNAKEYKILDVAIKILEIMGNPIKLLPGQLPYKKLEIWHHCADIEKARRLLSWQPKVSLEEGLRKTVEWFNEEFRRIKKRDI